MIVSRLIETPTNTSPARTAAAPATAKKKSCHSPTLRAPFVPVPIRRKCKPTEHDRAPLLVDRLPRIALTPKTRSPIRPPPLGGSVGSGTRFTTEMVHRPCSEDSAEGGGAAFDRGYQMAGSQGVDPSIPCI